MLQAQRAALTPVSGVGAGHTEHTHFTRASVHYIYTNHIASSLFFPYERSALIASFALCAHSLIRALRSSLFLLPLSLSVSSHSLRPESRIRATGPSSLFQVETQLERPARDAERLGPVLPNISPAHVHTGTKVHLADDAFDRRMHLVSLFRLPCLTVSLRRHE
jgi:hypothetical protein